ncbi:NAD(P)H-dependent oxidoreductase [bacterium]|nr:MAG: NAD(P)H-dependent oxidoreductase [bacterium]
MIINFHPKEIESKLGVQVISELNKDNKHQVFHSTDKSKQEWQDIIRSEEELHLVAPVYWWGFSYNFDKWVQDVIAYGFAFLFDETGKKGLMNGRKFNVHLTHGHTPDGDPTMKENLEERLRTGIFNYVGAEVEIIWYMVQR